MYKIIFPLLQIFFLLWCNKTFPQQLPMIENQPAYDYTKTQFIRVFEGNHSVATHYAVYAFEDIRTHGHIIYEVILIYVQQFEEMIIPPGEPDYILELAILNKYNPGKAHLGQRLYLGDAWLSDGNHIAFLTTEDFQYLKSYLRRRNRDPGTQVKKDPVLKYANEDQLPDNWLPGPDSIEKAIQAIPPDDSRSDDSYKPGRRASRQVETEYKETMEDVQRQNKIESEIGGDIDLNSVNLQSPAKREVNKNYTLPHQLTDDKSPSSTRDDKDQGLKYWVIATLFALLFAWFLIRKFRR